MDIKTLKIAVIGVGNLGNALVSGLIESGVPASNIYATRRNGDKLDEIKKLKVQAGTDNRFAVKQADLILLCVKPFNYQVVLDEIYSDIDPLRQLVVSVITGVSIETLAAKMPSGMAIIRAMPNTAADVKESLTCICHNGVEAYQVELTVKIFDALGTTILIKEELMNSATVLGACGIAYVMRFIRAMVQGGIEIGFDAETAGNIVQHTVKGAATLLLERKTHPESEIDKVTTPKGCTIVGLNEMEHNGFSSALIKGLKASMTQIEQ